MVPMQFFLVGIMSHDWCISQLEEVFCKQRGCSLESTAAAGPFVDAQDLGEIVAEKKIKR